MEVWNAISYFAAGCFVGALCAGIAMDRYVMRMFRRSTAKLQEAADLLEQIPADAD